MRVKNAQELKEALELKGVSIEFIEQALDFHFRHEKLMDSFAGKKSKK